MSKKQGEKKINEIVDERTKFELYYPPYEGAIKAGVGAIMCGYNRVDGVYACENDQLLNHDLRGKLGFNGYVMSDWGGAKK
jgi:beta-glucosidase